MDERLYKVEEFNRNIPLLLSKYGTGHVHSKFTNGFNIIMGNDKLIFIGTTEGGRLPFALHLKRAAVHELISKINVNDTVSWDENKRLLRMNESCDVMYLEGKPYDNKMEEVKNSEQQLVTNLETILLQLASNDELTGLDLDINDFMEHYVEYGKKTNSPFDRYYDLMAILYSDNEEEIEEVLRYFLGRGRGGTPTGDDHLIGLLAIQSVSKTWSPFIEEKIKEIVYTEKITTDVSMEYLKYALNHQYGSPVIELIHAMLGEDESDVQEKVKNLISMGHSSGLDTLFGIVLGLLALRRKSNG